jgi:hypothetical protein
VRGSLRGALHDVAVVWLFLASPPRLPSAATGDIKMGRLHKTMKLAATSASALALATLAACDGTTVIGGGSGGGGGSSTTTTTGSGISTSSGPGSTIKVDKVDLLVSIDNSRSMADKQAILSLALDDLVQSLTNPHCVDGQGAPIPQQPTTGDQICPAGSVREFAPIRDMHIGILSSSLGGHGGNACPVPAAGAPCNPETNPSNNDKGHLLSRTTVCGGAVVPTYQSQGFLAWDPAATLQPPGETNAGQLTASFRDMVLGVGQVGCGYEAQMESWYRFLVDPEPYETISVQNNKATPAGLDTVLLQQRADFLRPDSLLAVLMLTDEDDCSIKESSYFYLASNSAALPRARKECVTNPNDPCCKSCALAQGSCPDDNDCKASPYLDVNTEDNTNLRCFDQKRRFGIDFLYPIDRYTQALTSSLVPDRAGSLVPNPIFSDLNPSDNVTMVRDPGLVVIAGIVGVPWQDIARDPIHPELGNKTAAELDQPLGNGGNGWDYILGDPSNYVPPGDPHMISSVTPRAGLHGPSSPDNADPINGHEYTISGNDDLQYACIFALPSTRDCLQPNDGCDCYGSGNDNPLCDSMVETTQVAAKAYPGTRELSLLKSVGSQGIVASICPKQFIDNTRADYAYRPAVYSLIDKAKSRLKL